MKFAKTLVALTVLGAAMAAHADSKIVSGAAGTALSADAHLDMRVVVPRVLFLRVGSGTSFSDNATVDRVDFNVGTADVVASGTKINGVMGSGPAPLTVQVVGNGGNITFAAAGSSTGLVDVASSDVIGWSQIEPTSTNVDLPHPAIGGAASTLVATSRVFNKTSTWSFKYTNASTVGEGQYDGRVTYTASML